MMLINWMSVPKGLKWEPEPGRDVSKTNPTRMLGQNSTKVTLAVDPVAQHGAKAQTIPPPRPLLVGWWDDQLNPESSITSRQQWCPPHKALLSISTFYQDICTKS